MLLSRLAIDAFWYGVWTFHTVPAARAFDAVGNAFLWPGRGVYRLLRGEESVLLDKPALLAGTNGLILGLLLYWIIGALRDLRRKPPVERNGQGTGQRAVKSGSLK